MPKLAWCKKKKLKWHSITTSLDYCLCASMPMYLLLTAGQIIGMPWNTTTVITIFVNFAALSECSCIRVLSKLFIYNGAFTTAWFHAGWLVSNETRYDDYQFRWNIFYDMPHESIWCEILEGFYKRTFSGSLNVYYFRNSVLAYGHSDNTNIWFFCTWGCFDQINVN